MKKIIAISLLIIAPLFASAASLASELSGRILLQVEQNGEAWYVSPSTENRYYMGRPQDAFNLMRNLGVGITNNDLNKIAIAEANFDGTDIDEDGLSDMIEDSFGTDKNKKDTDGDGYDDKYEIVNSYNPLGPGKLTINSSFSKNQKGKIFLQIERHGEAWYINPLNNKRYFLGRPLDAFNIMRSLGLGITDYNLSQIVISSESNNEPPQTAVQEKSEFKDLELYIHDLINNERTSRGLDALKWNSEIAAVAREHSLNLAAENESLTSTNTYCTYPIIHHEGYTFGIYQKDRLENRGVYYFGSSGENIALIPGVKEQVYSYFDEADNPAHECNNDTLESDFRTKLDSEPDETEKIKIIKAEIAFREGLMSAEKIIEFSNTAYNTNTEVANEAVTGWMNSPGHRANILKSDFNEAGIGIAKVKNYYIITQVFIKKVDCGYLGGPCCIKAGYYPSCYVPLSCELDVCK